MTAESTSDQATMERLFTIEQVAERLSVSTDTIRRLISSKDLPTVSLGRAVRIANSDIEALIQRRRGAR